MFQLWIGCLVAFTNLQFAVHGVRFDEELTTANHQVVGQLISSSAGGWPWETKTELQQDEMLVNQELKQDTRKRTKYSFIELVGSSGSVNVYRALNTKTNQNVVIKKLTDIKGAYVDVDEKRLINECKITAKLAIDYVVKCKYTRLDGVISKFSVLEDAGVDAVQYISKMSGYFEQLWHVIDIINQAVNAVTSVSSHRVIHRDLIPTNIMVKDDIVKLTGFEDAVFVDENNFKLDNHDKLISISAYGEGPFTPPEARKFWTDPGVFQDRKKTLETSMQKNYRAFDLWSLGMSLLSLLRRVLGSELVTDSIYFDYNGKKLAFETACKSNFAHVDDVLAKARKLLDRLLNHDPTVRIR
eukprot:TRINITY_DN23714_c0_g1_i1.p1 TRINITY_DN23714_c0_g1~~TRINITY_DN23714_c0_g1_i1.p1  ORF type:complete len:380 (+),score=28.29 TRINITY_DN23714_c0_g1_i1:73-1140(+)